MIEKILTVIVPTYNRKNTLARGLKAIIPQVVANRERVALYISDNCSDDGTDEYIQLLHAEYPDLFESKRQAQNLGAQGNFRDAVKSVKTKYVVIFSDDDLMLPNFVSIILSEISAHPDASLINYNALIVSSLGEYVGVRDPIVTGGKSRYYSSCGLFIVEHTHSPSLVTSNVFERKYFLDIIDSIDADEYPGYQWFAALVLGTLDRPVVYIDQPLLLQYSPAANRRVMNAPWYTAFGLTHLFEQVERKYAGVLGKWQTMFDANYKDFCLYLIGNHKDLYAERYAKLVQHSPSPSFSRQLKYYYYLPPGLCRFLFRLMPRVFHSLAGLF